MNQKAVAQISITGSSGCPLTAGKVSISLPFYRTTGKEPDSIWHFKLKPVYSEKSEPR